jgi:hypothetical protein
MIRPQGVLFSAGATGVADVRAGVGLAGVLALWPAPALDDGCGAPLRSVAYAAPPSPTIQARPDGLTARALRAFSVVLWSYQVLPPSVL